MEITSVMGRGLLGRRDVRLVVALFIALALVLGAFMLIQQQQPAEAQLGGNFFCGIILAIAEAFDDSPFFSFIAQILNSVLQTLGCPPISPG